MLRLRWLSRPRRPTYPTSTVVAHGSWRSTVTFQAQAFGIGKSGSCAVTTSGKSRRVAPPGAVGELAVAAVPLRPERIPDARLDRHLAAGFPAVLRVRVEHGGDPRCRRFRAELVVVVEIPEQCVRHREPRGLRMARIEKTHFTVLIVRRALARGGELNVVVLTGAFDEDAELR